MRIKIKTKIKTIVAVVVLFMASGCGFQLRGEVELPAVLSRVFVDGASRELVDELADALRRHGAVVGSAAVRVVVDAGFSRVVLTTDSYGRASAYALRYRVVFNVADGDEILLDDETITLNRAYDYDADLQLQVDAQVQVLEDEMRREMIARIVQRLLRLQ